MEIPTVKSSPGLAEPANKHKVAVSGETATLLSVQASGGPGRFAG